MSAAQIWAEINPTPQCAPKINVDVLPTNVTGKLISCTGSYNLNLTLKNRGFNNLTAATITARNGATVVTTQNWTGNLATYQTANTVLNITGAAAYDSLEIEVTAAGDQITSNDKFTVYIDNYTAANASSLPYNETMDAGNTMPSKLGFEDVSALNLFGFYDGINGTTKMTGATGTHTKAAFINFYNVQAGNAGTMVLGNYNTTSATNFLYLDIDIAYAQYTAAQPENDRMDVMVSTDCGATWTSVWNRSGNNLKTTNPMTSPFIPTAANQWAHYTIDISSVKNNPNALVAIKGTSDYGNYGWFDNIKVAASNTPTSLNEISLAALDIYPNPAQSEINIKGIYGDAQFTLVDVLGRTVKQINAEGINNNFRIAVNEMTPGNYYLKITQAGNTVTKSVVIAD